MGNEALKQFGSLLPEAQIDVREGESLDVLLASLGSEKSSHISINLAENSHVSLSFASFGTGASKVEIEAHLKKGATFEGMVAALSSKESNKQIYVSVIHDEGETQGVAKAYGIVAEKSSLTLSGVSHILKGSKKSDTRQESRVIVFDKGCKVNASPILKIDENDVSASHASAEGRLNEEHLFYLESRGVPEREARKLIMYGYLYPVIQRFSEEEQTRLIGEMERSIA